MSNKEDFEQFWQSSNLAAYEGVISPEQTISDTSIASLQRTSKHLQEQKVTEDQGSSIPMHTTLPDLPLLHIDSEVELIASPEKKENIPHTDLSILGNLGEGGMGLVQLAYQKALQRQVAVKTIREEIYSEEKAGILLQEALITGSLEHPNVIPIYLLGRNDNNEPVLVMRQVEGVSWEEMLQDPDHPLWKSRTTWTKDHLVRNIEILMEICNAIHFAHSKGILHRDIKPENVMIGEFGEVYILDWGIAKPIQKTQTNPPRIQGKKPATVAGTPAFMAPEMLNTNTTVLSEQTDVYLLGSTLHFLLTKQYRHTGTTLYETLFSVMASEPYNYPNDIPHELARICNNATHKDPSQRYDSALAFRKALATYLSHFNSIALCNTALDRLKQLRALCSQVETSSGPMLAQLVRRLFMECRFGFAQALQTWENNPEAKAGLQDSLELMIKFELSQRNLDAASALVGELPTPSEDLSQKLRQLHVELKEEKAEHQQLQKMAHELDITVSIQKRTGLLASTSIVLIVSASALLWLVRTERLVLSYSILLGMMVIGLAMMATITWKWRKQLLSHTANRNFLYFLLLLMVSMTFDRITGMVFQLNIAHVLIFEFILFGLSMGVAAIIFHPRFAWGILVSWFVVILSLVLPAYIYEYMLFMTAFMWLFTVYFFWKTDRID